MTKIEWCDETINPTIGCTKVSPACDNCYAEIMANRLSGMMSTKLDYSKVVENGKWNGVTVFRPQELEKPYKWKKPRRIFITSMGDLFHETVKFEWIDQIIGMISDNPQYTFIFLTKRPERCLEFFKWFGNEIKRNGFDSVPTQSDNPLDYYDPLPNIWIGVTVENQEQTKRIDELIKIPAAVHFISVEPMLENLNLEKWLSPEKSKIDWVICGAETGRKSRYMNPAWVRSLRDQCKESGVPFFMKKMSNKEEIPEDLLIREFPII